jgi:hypothetical protein
MTEMPEQDRRIAEAEPDTAADPAERDLEAPEADTAEQHLDVVEEPSESDDSDSGAGTPMEADPYDAAEQRRVVRTDEDDYR